MSVLLLSYWESDVYWRQNNIHFAELAPQNGGKQLIWRNYVIVTLCILKLNCFYPLRTITVTSRDPHYIAPEIKAKLRCKNKLMRAGRVKETAAVAKRIAIDITKCNKTRLNHVTSTSKKAVGTFGPQYESSQAERSTRAMYRDHSPNPQYPLCRNI